MLEKYKVKFAEIAGDVGLGQVIDSYEVFWELKG